MGAFGINAIKPQDGIHVIGFATARSGGDDALLEIWNGSSDATRQYRINEDGQIQAQNGAVGAPSYSYEADKDSGWYLEAVGSVAAAIGGSKIVDIESSGLTVTGALTATTLVGDGSAITALTASQVTDFSEAVDDRVNALLVAGDNVGITYNDAANTLTIAVATMPWADVTGTPTTATGYGITTIDGVVIGGTTPAAADFTTLVATSLALSGAITGVTSITMTSTLSSTGVMQMDTGGAGGSALGNVGTQAASDRAIVIGYESSANIALANAAGNSSVLIRNTGGSGASSMSISSALEISGNVGFYGTSAVAKPSVTGSRAGNAALASLLTSLASQGLITDSSSA